MPPTTASFAASRHMNYETAGLDEAFDADGSPRPHCAAVMEALAEMDLEALHERVRERLRAEGITFASADGGDEFIVDPVPRVVQREEWALLQRGLAQRARALNRFIHDAYGDRAIVAAGVVPERVLATADHFEREMIGCNLGPRPAAVIGFDVVRCADARLRVLEDNVRTPSGFAYAAAARAAVDAELPIDPPARQDPLGAVQQLGDLLAESADAVGGGAAAIVSDGPSNSAWWEHLELAEALSIPVVTPGDLGLRDGRLVARTGGSEAELAVVYRRTDEDRLTDERGRPTWLAELLLEPMRSGRLAVVNAPGGGVADDKLAHAYVEEMIRFYLDEEPFVESVRSFDLGRESDRAEVVARLEDMVVKPRSGLGGEGVVIYSLAGCDERHCVERDLEERPEDLIAQEAVWLSTHPTVCDGGLESRHVDLRCYVIGDELAPAPLTRMAAGRGELIVNSSRDGGAKDTWVLA